jgi:hypothetical protein
MLLSMMMAIIDVCMKIIAHEYLLQKKSMGNAAVSMLCSLVQCLESVPRSMITSMD